MAAARRRGRRGWMGLCGLWGGACGRRAPGVDRMSLCDGRGCAEQMTQGGGSWLKHSGHQHWKDVLPTCMPLNAAEAAAQLERVLC